MNLNKLALIEYFKYAPIIYIDSNNKLQQSNNLFNHKIDYTINSIFNYAFLEESTAHLIGQIEIPSGILDRDFNFIKAPLIHKYVRINIVLKEEKQNKMYAYDQSSNKLYTIRFSILAPTFIELNFEVSFKEISNNFCSSTIIRCVNIINEYIESGNRIEELDFDFLFNQHCFIIENPYRIVTCLQIKFQYDFHKRAFRDNLSYFHTNINNAPKNKYFYELLEKAFEVSDANCYCDRNDFSISNDISTEEDNSYRELRENLREVLLTEILPVFDKKRFLFDAIKKNGGFNTSTVSFP